MTQLLFIGGAWNFDPFALQTELRTRPEFAVVSFNPDSMLERLREATEHRASVWQGVNAKPSTWIEPAIRRLVPELQAAMIARARAELGRDAPIVVCSGGMVAASMDVLARLFPEAKFVHTVRDGAVAKPLPAKGAAPPTPGSDGYLWARNWTRYVAVPARATAELGERLFTLRAEDIDADRDAAIARLLDWLGIDGPHRWLGAWSAGEPMMTGENLATFYAMPEVVRLLAHYDYESHELPLDFDFEPHVAAGIARAWIDAGRAAEAEALLDRMLARTKGTGSSQLLEALGLLRTMQGREDDAVRSFLRAIQAGGAMEDAWIGLFALPHRSETLAIAEAARFQQQVSVRAALARWLVARGLDAEAAEIVANVEHQPWRA